MPEIPAQAEISLLIPICREKPDLGSVQNPDLWKTVQGCAMRHGMAPMVASAVRPYVNAADRNWCDQILAQSWASFQRSLHGLEFAAATLARRRIQLLALKGPLLAARCYDPAFLRMPSGDLDIAVRDCNFDEACAALNEVG